MINKLIIAAILVLPISGFAQDVVFEKDPAIDSLIPKWGPNRQHYFQTIFAMGLSAGKGDEGAEIRQPHFFDEFRFGFRYKRRFNNVFSTGFDLNYNMQNFRIRQVESKKLPDTLLYEKQRMIFHQVRGLYFIRFNYDRRGNRIGRYFDLGVYGDLNVSHQVFTRFKNPDQSVTRSYTSRLKYYNRIGYGVQFRAGFNRVAFYAQYRLSDFFYPSKNLPELPRIMAGIELSSKK